MRQDVRGKPHYLVGKLRSTLDDVRSSYWFLPMTMALAAGALAIGLVAVDRMAKGNIVQHIPWITQSEPDGTREVLAVIAGSMITVTGVVFSITVVAMTLASSQFGPRLLRNFLRDRGNQLTFGTFVGTFLYSLIVLRSVRENEVPHVSSAAAVLLALVSVFVLVYFIHHVVRSIQAASVIAAIAEEIGEQIPHLFPDHLGKERSDRDEEEIDRARQRLKDDGRDVLAVSDGYIRILDQDSVLQAAEDNGLVIELFRRPGDFVLKGSALARVSPSKHASNQLVDLLAETFVLGDHRTSIQDIHFLIGQLTQIALRSLSPHINDPMTACDCVHRLAGVLCAMADREMPQPTRYDGNRTLRVIAPAIRFEEIVDDSFGPIRRHGAAQIDVVMALFDSVARAAETYGTADRRQVLADCLERMKADFLSSRPPARDSSVVNEAYARAMSRMGLTPDPGAAAHAALGR
jgi:uncharacterized membrane protein